MSGRRRGGFHTMVGQRDSLNVGDEVAGRARSSVIIMDTLAAADFSEAFLALERSFHLLNCVPLQLVFVLLLK